MWKRAATADVTAPKKLFLVAGEVVEQFSDVLVCVIVLYIDTGCGPVCAAFSSQRILFADYRQVWIGECGKTLSPSST